MPALEINLDEDFGFTTVSEAEVTATQQELNSQLQMMYDAIIPLLKNLSANPENEMIKWPNRAKKIAEFKAKLDKIGGENIQVRKL